MRIEYELTPEYWAAFGEHCGRTAPGFRRTAVIGSLFGVVLILLTTVVLWQRSDSYVWLIIGFAGAGAWGLYWPRYLVSHARSHMRNREQPCLRGRHVMEAAANGLSAECEITSSVVKWPGIHAVSQTADHVFVMLSDVQGYVIPKKRVTSGDVEHFVRELHQHRGA